MRTVILTGPGELELIDRPVPATDGAALVRLDTVGICGTDVSIFTGKIPVAYPRVLGHELVGRVERPATGSVDELPPGTRVLVNPSLHCGRCPACRGDLEHLCPNGALIGRDRDGGFAEYVAVPGASLLPVPDDLPARDAALLQVLGTCVHAQRSFTAFPGQTAVVVGLGVAGLLMVQLLRLRGLTVVGVTRSAGKQKLGRRLGADHVFDPTPAGAALLDLTGGRGADVVIEAAGTPATFAQAVTLAGAGATVVLFGTIGRGADTTGTPFYDLYYKELTVHSPRAARHRDYARAIELAGVLDLAPLWTSSFPLGSARAALTAAGDPDQLKVTLDVT